MSDYQPLPTPEQILGLFQKYDLEPAPSEWLTLRDGRYCGCLIGALFVEQHGNVETADRAYASLMARSAMIDVIARLYGPAAAIGFNEGFTRGGTRYERHDDVYFLGNAGNYSPTLAVTTADLPRLREAAAIGVKTRELALAWWEERSREPEQRATLFSMQEESGA